MNPGDIKITGLGFSYGNEAVFSGLNLEIPRGRVTCILGPSGCGKTTLLALLAGLLPLQEGEIRGTEGEKTAFIFQEPRLLPWRSLRGNLDLVLRKAFPHAGEREQRISRILEMVRLEAYKDYYPASLSGGMRQRASLARAFAFPSSILLMDEPFQALDPVLKLQLTGDFLRLHREDPRTCLLVTHDVEEAALLGDRIFVFTPKSAGVFREMENPLSRESRNSRGRELLELEGELFSVIMEASGAAGPMG